MNIAVTGPEKYDFQDIVCVSLFLNLVDKSDVKFYVEPQGLEDAFFSYINEYKIEFSVEVQVKGSEKPVNLKMVSKCLMHFPEKLDKDFLLQRLLDKKDLNLLFAMSGRATDALLPFLPEKPWLIQKLNSRITKSESNAILKELRNLTKKSDLSDLQTRRQDHIRKYLDLISIKDLQEALRRVVILENITFNSVFEECRIKLRKLYNIPDDIIADVIGDVIQAVKAGKKSKANLTAQIKQILQDRSEDEIKPKGYLQRGTEESLISKLKQENVLLLSGKPRVGKSQTACWIAGHYQSAGYRIKSTSDVFEAYRFLEDSVAGPRLVLLDDPLGGRGTKLNSQQSWQELREKIKRATNFERKIIVAQGQETLFEVCGCRSLNDANILELQWLDLGDYSVEFIQKYWKVLGDEYNVPTSIYQQVKKSFESDNEIIEPGCLQYLAVEHVKLNIDANMQEIRRFARQSAETLAINLKQEGCTNILQGIALTTSEQDEIHHDDLAYVLTNTDNSLLSYSDILGTGTSLGANTNDEEPTVFPEYPKDPNFTHEDNQALEMLEAKRMIEWHKETVKFSHPFYRAAAECLVKSNTRGVWKHVYQLLQNAIFCLSPKVSKSGAKNLVWIYAKCEDREKQLQLAELATEGLKSSFPSTRDNCFYFLMSIIGELPDELIKEQESWVTSVTGDKLDILSWHNGYPFYPMGRNLVIESNYFAGLFESEFADVARQVLNKLNCEDFFVLKPQEAFGVLRYCKHNPDQLVRGAMLRILALDEGLIRAFAGEVWLQTNRSNDSDIITRILGDQHPSMARSVLDALLRTHNPLSDGKQQVLVNGLKTLASSSSISTILLPHLVKLDHYEKCPECVFNTVAELLPIALTNVPEFSYVNFPRLTAMTEHLLDKVREEKVLVVLDAWVTALEKNCSARHINSGYDISVMDFLLKNTACTLEERQNYLVRLLRLYQTDRLIGLLGILLNSYKELTQHEIEQMVELLTQERSDKIWLQAKILIQNQTPEPLLERVFSYSEFLHDETDDRFLKFIICLDKDLQRACIILFVEHNYMDLTKDSTNVCSWEKFIWASAQLPDNDLFELSFQSLLRNENHDQMLASFIQKFDEEYVEQVFEVLLNFVCDSVAEYRPLCWLSLFGRAKHKNQLHSWLDKLASRVNLICDDIKETSNWLPEQVWKLFLDYLPNDTRVMLYFHHYDRDPTADTVKPLNEFLEDLQNYPPDHFSTCRYVIERLRRDNIDSPVVKNMELLIDEIIKEKNDAIVARGYEVRKGWV